MDIIELEELIAQKEGIKLDFKLDYKLDKTPPYGTDKQLWIKFVKGQWDELIKDIIALTNGNVGTADQVGRLIIGVGDTLLPNGTRNICDTSHLKLSPQQIMAKVNTACEPPIADLVCEGVSLGGKLVQVITIPPSPHVHETSRQLNITKGEFDGSGQLFSVKSDKTYTERTAFIRTGEDIAPASNAMRRALESDKGYHIRALNESLKFELIYNLMNLVAKSNGRISHTSGFVHYDQEKRTACAR